MALFKCPGCGRKISESARRCPSCGAPNDLAQLANSPYMAHDSTGRLKHFSLVPTPCPKCGKMVDPKSERTLKRYPGGKASEGDLFYYWHPDCYDQAEREYNQNDGCLCVVMGFILISVVIIFYFLRSAF